jgi:uncharacterized protein
MNEKQAIALLKKYSKDEKGFDKVLKHVQAVKDLALEISEEIPSIDIEKVRIGSLLHDIGRFDCFPNNADKHGIRGAEILRSEGLHEYALICERHLGAGISKEEIKEQKLNLPLQDYIPITKEEKVIAHADNLIEGNKRITLEQAVERFHKEIGKKAADKIKKLAEEVKSMKK